MILLASETVWWT